MNCVFCEQEDIHLRVIAENGLARAFPTYIPVTPGHTLVVPKRHVQTVGEVTHEELVAIFDLTEKIKKGLRGAYGAQGFNHAWNEAEIAGQSVMHFHIHIVPRTPGDTGILKYDPREFLYRPGDRPETPQADLLEVSNRIRAHL